LFYFVSGIQSIELLNPLSKNICNLESSINSFHSKVNFYDCSNSTALLLFRSKTKNGVLKITLQKINTTLPDDSITLIHSHYGISNVILGKNIPEMIYISSSSTLVYEIYNGVDSLYFFNNRLFKEYFSENSQISIKSEVSFYNPMRDLMDIPLEKNSFLFNLNEIRPDLMMVILGIEHVHPAIFSFSLLFHLLVLVGCVLFRNYQPLKAHGFVPLLACSIFTFKFILGINHFIPYYNVSGFLVRYVNNCFQDPTYISFFLILPLNLLRYLILNNLNYNKMEFKTKAYKKTFFLRILILLSNPISIPIFIFFVYVGLILVYFTFTILFDYKTSHVINVIFLFLFGAFIVTLGSLMVIIDFIHLFKSNFHSKKGVCKISFLVFKKIFKEDVLYYRIQNYIIGLLVLFPFWLIGFSVNYFKIFPQNEFFFVTSLIHTSLHEYLFEFYACGFFVIVSCVTRVRLCFQNPTENTIIQAFHEKELWELFSQFSRFEFSTENIECYQDLQQYKLLKSEKIEFLHQLNSFYFMEDSQLEVNVSNVVKNKFKEKLNQGIVVDDELLRMIENEVETNLSDTWSRFILTKEYQKYELYKGILEQQKLIIKSTE
jgi:hypothetical protein